MDQPGVTTSPIQLISGKSDFCQTFFQDARVEKRDVVGPWNGGWTVGKRLLQHERQGIAKMGVTARKEITLRDRARELLETRDGRIADGVLRDRIAAAEMQKHAMQATTRRVGDEAKGGGDVSTTSSILKLLSSEIGQERSELLIEMMGTQGFGWEGDAFSEQEIATTRGWLRSKAQTIEGGSSEVQLNIIAKRVLGLPD